jgi:hypothetical protein
MTRETLITKGDSRAGAVFSACGLYRYRLWRAWGEADGGDRALFITLNPSTATHEALDPTVRRCCVYARDWGYDGVEVVNLFALRSTDPKALRRVPDPVGKENDIQIVAAATSVGCGRVICAWGADGEYMRRARHVIALLLANDVPLHYLRQGQRGPCHPLYLPKRLTPQPWEIA